MTAGAVAQRRLHLVPPGLAAALVAAALAWAYPQDLPAWRTLGITSAWAGTALLVASLLLMLREPRLARAFGGLEAMVRWHHRCGVVAYVLLLLHPLSLAAQAWAEEPRRAWQTLAPWQQSWPLWLGWASLVLLMVGLWATFDRRLAYRPWMALHRTLGLAVLLGCLHVLVLLGNPVAVVVGTAVAALAWAWRLAVIDRGLSGHTYRVAEVAHPGPGVVEARLTALGGALRPRAGQFVLARFLDGPGFRSCAEFHPFTVSGIDTDGSLRVAIKALGACTTHIQGIGAGLLVRLQGPFGDFLTDVDGAPQLWVAGGIGITPFMAALRLKPRQQATTLIYLHRSATDDAFVDELLALQAADPRLRVVPVADVQGPSALAPLLDAVDGLAGRTVQVCGPPGLVQALLPLLRQRGVPDASIHSERFDFR